MSESVKKFYEVMSRDKALQEKSDGFLKEAKSKNLTGDALNDFYDGKILGLAKELGYEFSLEEAKEFNKKMKVSFAELSDDDLENVAGGFSLGDNTLPLVAYAVFPSWNQIDWGNVKF